MTKNTTILEKVKNKNTLFFSKDTCNFHEDIKYTIEWLPDHVRPILVVHNKLTDKAYYTIGSDYRLKYTTLNNDVYGTAKISKMLNSEENKKAVAQGKADYQNDLKYSI